jgi:hypothetical protein
VPSPTEVRWPRESVSVSHHNSCNPAASDENVHTTGIPSDPLLASDITWSQSVRASPDRSASASAAPYTLGPLGRAPSSINLLSESTRLCGLMTLSTP